MRNGILSAAVVSAFYSAMALYGIATDKVFITFGTIKMVELEPKEKLKPVAIVQKSTKLAAADWLSEIAKD